MSESKLTGKALALLANRNDGGNDYQITEFILRSPARDLQEFIHNIGIYPNSQWFHRAKVALEIRLAEDAAETADKLIKHTEKLTQQNVILVQESRALKNYTIVLVILTVAIVIQTGVLIWKEYHK